MQRSGAGSAANSGKVTSSLGASPPGRPRGPLGRFGDQGGESGINSLGELSRLGPQNNLQVADLDSLGSEVSSWWLGRSLSEAGKSRLAILRPFRQRTLANSLRELARSSALGSPATRSICGEGGWGVASEILHPPTRVTRARDNLRAPAQTAPDAESTLGI